MRQSPAEADDAVVDEVLVLKTAKARDEARRLADAGDFEGGRSLLRASADELRLRAPRSSKAAELVAEADLLEDVSNATAAPSYDASTQKRLHYESHRTRRKRGR